MRFSEIVLIYFMMGAIMWGGGAIAWSETGLSQVMIDVSGDDVETNSNVSSRTENLGGPISQVVGAVGGGLVAMWNIAVMFVGFLYWPVLVLETNNAPLRVVVVAGGGFSVVFLMALARTIRGTI